MDLKIKRLRGTELATHLDQLGELRIQVFRDFPYLYEGTLAYERQYLQTYLRTNESHLTLVFDEDRLVGATTAILAKHEESAFQEPFRQHGFSVEKICYFGESILLTPYRGLGLGKIFMTDRLQFARGFPEIEWASFCAVVRPADHPLRPANYQPLDGFWRSMGFSPIQGLTTTYKWKDLDQEIETEKTLQFWMQNLKEQK